jgi:hypothetical protein
MTSVEEDEVLLRQRNRVAKLFKMPRVKSMATLLGAGARWHEEDE